MRRAISAVFAVALLPLGATVAFADEGPPKPSPSPTPPPVLVQVSPEQLAQANAIAEATSLLVRIDAERDLAAAERAFVADRLDHLRAEHLQIVARVATLQVEADRRQAELDRLVQREYRASRTSALEVLMSTGSIVSALLATDAIGSLAGAEHDALLEVQRVPVL